MGILSRLVNGFGIDAGDDYDAAVHERLTTQFKLDRSRQWRLKAYDGLIQEYKGKRIPAGQTAVEVAVAYYLAQCLGDADDREDASRLYMPLKPAIHLAWLSGDISIDRLEQLNSIVRDSTQQSMFKDMEERTGAFSPDTQED